MRGLSSVMAVLSCLALAPSSAAAKTTQRDSGSGSGSAAAAASSSGSVSSVSGSAAAGRVCAMSNDKEAPSKDALPRHAVTWYSI